MRFTICCLWYLLEYSQSFTYLLILCCVFDVWVDGIDNFQINEVQLHLVFCVNHPERPPCSHRYVYISAQRNAYCSFWLIASFCCWVKNLLNLVTEIFTDLDYTNRESCCQKSLSHSFIFTEAAKPSFPTSSFTHALFVSFSWNHTTWWKDSEHVLKSCFCLQLAVWDFGETTVHTNSQFLHLFSDYNLGPRVFVRMKWHNSHEFTQLDA